MLKQANRIIMLVVLVVMMFTVIGCTGVALPHYLNNNENSEHLPNFNNNPNDVDDKNPIDSIDNDQNNGSGDLPDHEENPVDGDPITENPELENPDNKDNEAEDPNTESPDETEPGQVIDENGIVINNSTNLTYKIAIAHTDGTLDYIESYDTYNTAELRIEHVPHDDAVIVKNGQVIYAKYGLLNLGIKSSYLITEFTHNGMDYYTNGQYGDDALFVDTHNNSVTSGSRKYFMLLNGNPGLVDHVDVELLPMTWVKSMSYYMVNTSGELVHVYATDLERAYQYVSSQPLDQAPNYLNRGLKYYSYDGHYFYTDYKHLVDDRRNGVTTGAVNNGAPYYNYYQYLSYRTKTNYTAGELDAYIDYALTKKGYQDTSILSGSGKYFINSQETFGINAALELAMGFHESHYGTSSIARNKNNIFGMNATDHNPYGDADGFDTLQGGIDYHVRYYITSTYLNPDKFHYNGQVLGNKRVGFNVYYASDPYWGEKIASHYYLLDKYLGFKDRKLYQVGITNEATDIYLEPSMYSEVLYREAALYDAYKKGLPVVIQDETLNYYEILLPAPLVGNNLSPYSIYDYNSYSVGYIRKTDVDLVG
ncbi:glucosaminidase domain-containing protein [Haloplasma contractile]|uniref:Mannosyl-glycoprotein endo-beta-N-acetylglucosaminidase n=1 Tax=Haloplasma contractile SSD-17B TaxID=1033810 RepID=U2FK07_9MOLU|nr:glucosaminidase domain-containing protein [Haloplasma contractile]ERJ11564.1 mannosyl-glycoprotein endo-beta-N-acetylglucosaminidase [Haloplasma contractile SSD-17B]